MLPGEEEREPQVLILTPFKNAARHVDSYFSGIRQLRYPRGRLALGMLESDSSDGTHARLCAELKSLQPEFCAVDLWKRDFGFQIPAGVPRYDPSIQVTRRVILAKSRNHLLFRALRDHDWVLWLDSDVSEYPGDVIERLLATGKDIVQPNCVLDYGGESFDRNAWRDHGQMHLHDLRDEGELVPLDSVGGTMLLIRADLHRDGLIFPAFRYGLGSERVRTNNEWQGEIETEGLGIMAADMGVQCWGMPRLEIRHHRF
jgi:Anp1